MDSFFITLTAKKQLTHDVYELIYSCDRGIKMIPGQFLLCDTDSSNPKLRRSYSVQDWGEDKIHFIIKAIPDGKGGSKAICTQPLGHSMQVWGPMGNFILPDTVEKIIFIGTGTGFAPLYFQAKKLLEKNPNTEVVFIFGVREERDVFYREIFEAWSEKYPHFCYQLCLSQGTDNIHFRGRVTEYLKNTPSLMQPNNLYSICGSPAMVSEVRHILSSEEIPKEQIFFEQY